MKYLALFAAIILGVSGLAMAQQTLPNPNLGQGYYGEQAPVPAVAPVRVLSAAAAQSSMPNPNLGQGYYGQQASAPAVAQAQHEAPTEVRKHVCCAPTARAKNPIAPQNQIEYRGA